MLRSMIRWSLGCASLLLFAVLALFALRSAVASPAPYVDEVERQRAMMQLEAERQSVELSMRTEQALAPVQFVALASLWLAIPAGLLIALGAIANALYQRRRALVLPAAGLLPIARDAVADGAALDVALAVILEQARTRQLAAVASAERPIMPERLHYAPHVIIKHDASPASQALPSAEAPAVRVPTFAQLLASGRIGEGQPLLLGVDSHSGEMLTGSWLDLYSVALGGVSGSGKSTTARYLIAQAAMLGCQFAVIDPHAGAGDDSLAATLGPLAGRMICKPASNDKSILDTARLIRDIGKRRIAGQDQDRTPILLAIDEATALLSRSAIAGELGELIEEIAQEYRKCGIFALCSGQIWTASRTGGSPLRDAFASVYGHRMKRNQARLIVPAGEAIQVERLATGQALLWRTSGESQVVSVPLTTGTDIEGVARLLEGHRTGMERAWNGHIPRLTEDAGGWVDMPGIGRNMPDMPPSPVSAEAVAAARMFFEQKLLPATIVLEMRGVRSNEGTKYQNALAEICELIRAGSPHVRVGGGLANE